MIRLSYEPIWSRSIDRGATEVPQNPKTALAKSSTLSQTRSPTSNSSLNHRSNEHIRLLPSRIQLHPCQGNENPFQGKLRQLQGNLHPFQGKSRPFREILHPVSGVFTSRFGGIYVLASHNYFVVFGRRGQRHGAGGGGARAGRASLPSALPEAASSPKTAIPARDPQRPRA
jgi:hypothetical protein